MPYENTRKKEQFSSLTEVKVSYVGLSHLAGMFTTNLTCKVSHLPTQPPQGTTNFIQY